MNVQRWGAHISREEPSPTASIEFLKLARADELIASSCSDWPDSRLLKYYTAHKLDHDSAVRNIHSTVVYMVYFRSNLVKNSIVWPALDLYCDNEFAELDATEKLFWLPHKSCLDGNPVLIWKTRNHDASNSNTEKTTRWLVHSVMKALQHGAIPDRLYLLVDKYEVCNEV
jgi:hypothetical protein